jgi:hypothetical protein
MRGKYMVNEKNKKILFTVSIILICLLFYGAYKAGHYIGARTDQPQSNSTDNYETNQVDTKEATVSEGTASQNITLSGSGQHSTSKISPSEGVYTVKVTYEGTGDFKAVLLDSGGNQVESIAEKNDSFQETKEISIAIKDEYTLNITATGTWSIDLSK